MELFNGTLAYSATGLDGDAAAFFEAVLAEDLVYLMDFILGGDDVIHATDGRKGDIIESGDGNDTVYGYDGDDDLRGMAGRDQILGGRGDDTLNGGEGRDVLKGNQGADHFVFTGQLAAGNADRIADYHGTQDIIVVAFGRDGDGTGPIGPWVAFGH